MPKDISIKKVLVIGSGPIVIGQAAEFDYSGTQAVSSFKEEGVEVVLVNSNPATIMTDIGMAHYTYIEPLNIDFLEKVIAKERPDSIIAGMGGQTGLNLACELYDKGILDKYHVRVIGTSIDSIKEGEDRDSFKKLMERTNQPIIESKIITDLEDGVEFAKKIGYPVIIRPAYTLGGTGGGIAENEDEFREICTQGLHFSRVGQVLIEKSIKGWKEIEFEVIRDGAGNCITVCSMENVDPVGVHTGDSIVVAPAQTLTDREYQMLRTAAINIINSIEIKGGCNVQFALDPNSYNYAVIEINPRVSRSSALASKATGYPIAKVAAKIALGYNLDEIKNEVTGKTFACFEPTLDYVVLKIPRWPFDKFYGAKRTLGTKMMATGEVMAIANNFEMALLKGVRSLEIGQYGLERKSSTNRDLEELKNIYAKYSIFARAKPEQKEEIVRLLEENNHKVAYIGDGVNDITSLRRATSSIALNSGVSSSKIISDFTLLDDDFSSLPNVIKEGRRVLKNIERTCTLFIVKDTLIFLFALYSLVSKNGMVIGIESIYIFEFIIVALSGFLLSIENTIPDKYDNKMLKRSFILGGISGLFLSLPGLITGMLSFFIDIPGAHIICSLLISLFGPVILFGISYPLSKYSRNILIISSCLILFGLIFAPNIFLNPFYLRGADSLFEQLELIFKAIFNLDIYTKLNLEEYLSLGIYYILASFLFIFLVIKYKNKLVIKAEEL